jgi:hypothetical protein
MSDFSQVYYACDDYFMLNRKDQWCGIIQRAVSGFDLFVLEGLFPGVSSPESYYRIQSWVNGFPDDIRVTLANLIKNDPKFSFEHNNNNNNNNNINMNGNVVSESSEMQSSVIIRNDRSIKSNTESSITTNSNSNSNYNNHKSNKNNNNIDGLSILSLDDISPKD